MGNVSEDIGVFLHVRIDATGLVKNITAENSGHSTSDPIAQEPWSPRPPSTVTTIGSVSEHHQPAMER
jgi:hypothetical protein